MKRYYLVTTLVEVPHAVPDDDREHVWKNKMAAVQGAQARLQEYISEIGVYDSSRLYKEYIDVAETKRTAR